MSADDAPSFEDDTALSLIRRLGFPPYCHYPHQPMAYTCPCCANLSPPRRRSHSAMAEYRKTILQETIIEDRARTRYPEPTVWPHTYVRSRSQSARPRPSTATEGAASLPPPPTINDARAAGHRQHRLCGGPVVLRLTIHRGSNFDVPPRTSLTVQARLGRYVGETRPLLMRKKALKWGEQFALPMSAADGHPLELRVMAGEGAAAKCVGVGIIAHLRLFDPLQGKQTSLPIGGGKLVLSWKLCESSSVTSEQDVHTEAEAPPIPQGTQVAIYIRSIDLLPCLPESSSTAEFVLRDARGAYTAPVAIPWDSARRAHDCSMVPTLALPQATPMVTLLCVRRQEQQDSALVIASAVLDTRSLPLNSSAKVPLCAYPDGAVVGHVVMEWLLTASPALESKKEGRAADEAEAVDLTNATLSVTVVRGINLTDAHGHAVQTPSILVACGTLQATIPAMPREGSDVLWNQEVEFTSTQSNVVECTILNDGEAVAYGEMAVDHIRGIRMVTVTARHSDGRSTDCGHILLKYRVCDMAVPYDTDAVLDGQEQRQALEVSTLRQQRESPVHSGVEETLGSARKTTRRWPPAVETAVSPKSPLSPHSARSRDVSPPLSDRRSPDRLTPTTEKGSPRGRQGVVDRRSPERLTPTAEPGSPRGGQGVTMSWIGARTPKSPPQGPSSPHSPARKAGDSSPKLKWSFAEQKTLLPNFDPQFSSPTKDAFAASAPVAHRRRSKDSPMGASVSELRESRRWKLPATDTSVSETPHPVDKTGVSASPRNPLDPDSWRWSLRDVDTSALRDKWNGSTRLSQLSASQSSSRNPDQPRRASVIEKGAHEKPPRIFFKATPGGQIAFFREGDPIPPNMPAATDSLYGSKESEWPNGECLPQALEAEQKARELLKEQLNIQVCTKKSKKRLTLASPWYPAGCSTLDIHYPFEERVLAKVSESAIRLLGIEAENMRLRMHASRSASNAS